MNFLMLSEFHYNANTIIHKTLSVKKNLPIIFLGRSQDQHIFCYPTDHKNQVKQAAFKMPIEMDTAPNSAPTATLLPISSGVASLIIIVAAK